MADVGSVGVVLRVKLERTVGSDYINRRLSIAMLVAIMTGNSQDLWPTGAFIRRSRIRILQSGYFFLDAIYGGSYSL